MTHRLALLAAAVTVAALAFPGCAGPGRHQAPGELSGAWVLTATPHASDLVLFESGQCVVASPDRLPSGTGSRGFHRPSGGGGVVCILADGSALELARRDGRMVWSADPLGGHSRSWLPAVRVPSSLDQFVGIWRLNPEPSGEYHYIQLHADGAARTSLDRAVGRWEPWGGGALCTWPGGWRDWLVSRGDGFVNRSWPPGAPLSEAPSDFSIALRVGGKPFEIRP